MKKRYVVSVKLTEGQHEALLRLCEYDLKKRGQIIRAALRSYVMQSGGVWDDDFSSHGGRRKGAGRKRL